MVFTLWKDAAEVAKSATKAGALNSFKTSMLSVQEGSLNFHVRILDNLQNKPTPDSSLAKLNQSKPDPFLPHEEALFVTNIGDNHKCLLNKYNVVDEHLLLVTQAFEEQNTALNKNDFYALHRCLCAAPALAFYNSGKTAGASQTHKHLQLIKVPETVEQLIAFNPQLSELHDEVPRELDSLPFRHAALALPKDIFTEEKIQNGDGAAQLQNFYNRLRMTLGIEKDGEKIARAYNLLLSHHWMLMVPRTGENFSGVSLNALAFSGSILVKSEAQAHEIIEAGLSTALNVVSWS
ncbi:hypothetical protein [Neptuniibacter sp. 1_MG-2023]|uniref:hypothetical protein n=1 Tax=Neptuniibacter sp. 1_MG-2023 TaxID=3062662 RepID=UPI0026E15EBD|nr:hypothetical protein [Neptuniibacter sp. 1_MG-2023]MDO6593563.1 hypothetical protein [Neptuniibacter sp. 1_MG-2023]